MINKIKLLLKQKLKNFIRATLLEEIDGLTQIQSQMKEFNNADEDMLYSKVIKSTSIENIIDRFKKLNIPVIYEKIDIIDFNNWRKKYKEIDKYYRYLSDVYIEKVLEHYLTMKFLDIKKKDTLIDIAALGSPYAKTLKKRLGNRCFSQDLVYEKGIKKDKIGGDAGFMPISDCFADVLTLHCAYECFQSDSDINFIKETQRVLSNKGRLGIVPLYVDDVYFVMTGPKYDKRKVKAEDGARWIWRDDKCQSEPFSRHYNPESFKERIINNISNMKYKIIHFTNIKELEKYYNNQRIYCNFMFVCEKQ
ncbi:MAG TPA: hypothetical protein PK385_02470 [Spirochaetota bacterium]|jgi:hypothetical protein|nr:MAG: hypothetical protein BWX91_00747 [Spirochaetes bacterium ADurb.Bin133]HNZ26111.1 hypothetical protein [Spirochaetota bacterium]HOF00471.1 hypothetical protein [Spirochaetota bacterium]HOS31645.1 hypothetical protein [Spirochaetota bacterium]HOS54903.1 hypothetical protein [Spirochaetota bacterium]